VSAGAAEEPTSAMGFTPVTRKAAAPDSDSGAAPTPTGYAIYPGDGAPYAGRHRRREPDLPTPGRVERTRRGGVRGFAAVLPWNWRRRNTK
jgi:hypothetical protein